MKFQDLVLATTKREGKKIVALSVAQSAEAVKIILEELAQMPMGEACALIAKHGSKRPKR